MTVMLQSFTIRTRMLGAIAMVLAGALVLLERKPRAAISEATNG